MWCKLREPYAHLKHGYFRHVIPFPILIKSRKSMILPFRHLEMQMKPLTVAAIALDGNYF